MSVQLLDKTRKINKLLHNNNSSKVVFNDICDVLKDILNSNILVISKKGKVLGTGLTDGVEEIRELIVDEVGGFIDPLLNERLLGILSTKENVNLETLGFVDDVKKYIKLGKLGEAFSADEQVVLLIDEIDKADLEFPNDLLWELDRMEFYIPETKETVQAKQRPIVIITSNAEKELPDAFLRRCVFHYIEFPEQEQMEAILRVHFGDLEEKLVKQSLAAFYWLRELRGIEKKPSTSELVDWIRALVAGGVDPARIEKEIPFAGVLLKKDKDLQTLRKVK